MDMDLGVSLGLGINIGGHEWCVFDLEFFFERGGTSATCPPNSASFPFMAQPSNADSHDHVIGLMGSAFNEGVLLDIDH